MKRKREDEEAWRNGFYMMSAINKALGGKKAKYLEEPLMESAEAQETPDEEMTEAQKKKARDALLAKLQIMQVNFEMNHKDDDGGDEGE